MPARLLNYRNVPRTIGMALSSNCATLHELQTVYSLEDLFDLLEVVMVDSYNTKVMTPKE